MSEIKLTDDILAQLKEANPGMPLYKKTLFNQDYVFTVITTEDQTRINDYVKRNPKVVVSQVDDTYVEYALKFPELTPVQRMILPAGVYPTLAQLIKEKSLLELPANANDFSSLYSVEVIVDVAESATPDEKIIKELKTASQHALHAVKIFGKTFIVRPLLRPEWTSLQQSDGTLDLDAAIASRCTIWPSKCSFEGDIAGIPLVLARHILMFSGFQDSGEVTEL